MKTPSRIAYAKENRDLDDDQVGFHVTPGLTSCSWFKLFLQPDKQYETWLVSEGIGMMRLPSGKSAQEVCTDYLKGIYEEIVTTLRRNSGSVFAATPIDFLFTVPAIWSLNAKNDTLKAASGAGFGSRRGDSMVLIPEPEAAALAVLDQLASNDLAQIEPGDILMIVDCGGGTVVSLDYP